MRPQTPTKNINHNKGFTLLEVMVALSIVATLLMTLIYTVNNHLEVAARHESITRGVLLARQKLVEVKEGSKQTKGVFPAPDDDFAFNVQKVDFGFKGIELWSVIVVSGDERVEMKDLVRKEIMK